jgi:FAD/FMN-containing dehydrogenase
MNNVKSELISLFGEEHVFDEADILAKYNGDRSFANPIPPRFVVKPQNAVQVENLVKWANETFTPLVPISSGGPHFRGDTAPSVPETVIVDLSGMKKILSINKTHRMAVIEPGVTYGELAETLAREGMFLAPCLAPRATKSVVGSLLEVEPRLNAMHQWAFTDPLRCMEVTWGDGNRMYTGEAGLSPMNLEQQWKEEKWQVEPVGPMMLDFFRLLTAAQGTMGVVTWASIRCELNHRIHKTFLVPAGKEEDLVEFIRRVVHFRFSDQLFILNGAQLASLVGADADEIKQLKKEIPAWVAVVGIGGRDLLPEERVAQQEADIADIAQKNGLKMLPAVSGIAGGKVMAKAANPCEGIFWKERTKGAFQDIFFVTTLDRTPEFIAKMDRLAIEASLNPSDIGIYVQPLHCGSSYHLEFTLFYNPGNKAEAARIKALFFGASEVFGSMGAFYTRPYGAWAGIQMNKDAMGKKTLDKLKNIFDPNGIMNPGKLGL